MGFDFSLVSAPFRMQPGLRRIAPGTPQLTPARPNGRHLREKMAVLGSFPAQALVAQAGFDERPALRVVAEEASPDASPAFRLAGSSTAAPSFEAPRLGWSIDPAGTPQGDGDPAIGELLRSLDRARRPAGLLALAFEEDFAVIDAATTTIPWLAVCLPSRWAPESKVGLPFAAVHGPVADNSTLIAAAPSLARLVSGDDRWERFVWTVTADPRLHQHPARSAAIWPAPSGASLDAEAEELAAVASFRSERQTFIPLPGGEGAVFTIRVDSVPLTQAVAAPDDARRLHAAIASMSANVLAYRGLEVARDRLLHWLARVGQRSPPA
jgi:hypothetical protein